MILTREKCQRKIGKNSIHFHVIMSNFAPGVIVGQYFSATFFFCKKNPLSPCRNVLMHYAGAESDKSWHDKSFSLDQHLRSSLSFC